MLVAGPNTSRVTFKKESALRLADEWQTLHSKNPALYSIIAHLAGFSGIALGRYLVITQIWRSQEEQKQIYGASTRRKSPHQNWCAVDLRCKDLSENERAILQHGLKKYDQLNKFRHMPSSSRTVWIHAVPDGGIHFHVQFWGNNRMLPSRFDLVSRDISNIA